MIFNLLVNDTEYFQKVYPHLREEYFGQDHHRLVFQEIKEYVDTYRHAPSLDILSVEVKNRYDIKDDKIDEAKEFLKGLDKKQKISSMDWAIKETEEFCRFQAIFNAARNVVEFMDDPKLHKSLSSAPDLFQKALAVSFDPKIGHDIFNDWEQRFDYYHSDIERIPFRLPIFNRITKGGCPRKTLNCVVAGTNQFKSGFLCDLASGYVEMGYNVLYITLELSREMVAQRVDANLMDLTVDQVMKIDKTDFERRIDKIKKMTRGRIIVEEYPTASANANHFRALVHDLELKKSFKPDVIIVDYLNICTSSRFTQGGMYELNKKIAEELRGLMVELDVVGWTATQTNRGGQSNSDLDFEDVGESHGVSQTLDFLISLYASEELAEKKLIKIGQIKSRYDDVNKYKSFLVGVNKDKMKLYPQGDEGNIYRPKVNEDAREERKVEFNFD